MAESDVNGEPAFELGCDGATTIVVGVDGTPPSWRALHYAVGLARREASRVVAVHAHSENPVAYASPVLPPPVVADDEAAAELMPTIARLAEEHQVDILFLVTQGDSVSALTAVAEEQHADLIVVGASSKPGHRLFGSTSVRAVRARCCPVTVIP